MSQENVETVKRAIAAVNDRDIDRYLACCTEDVQLWTPLASIGAVYEGVDARYRLESALLGAPRQLLCFRGLTQGSIAVAAILFSAH